MDKYKLKLFNFYEVVHILPYLLFGFPFILVFRTHSYHLQKKNTQQASHSSASQLVVQSLANVCTIIYLFNYFFISLKNLSL